jgi:hypothetical protein
LPRSVGFGPVASPPRGRVPCLHLGWPATNPIARRLPVFPTESGAAAPRHLLLASLAISASRSSRCHSAHLGREHLPGNACRQDKQDPGEYLSIGNPWPGAFRFLGSGGSRGSMFCQSSSLANCFAIPQSYQFLGFC